MDYLSRREHSRYELYQKLSKHNFERVLINEQLERLVNENLLSDQRYVEAFVHSRKRNGKGPVKISAEKQSQGFAHEIELTIPYSSTCPCSASLARQLYADAINRAFSEQTIDKAQLINWVQSAAGSVATPHSQRSYAYIRIALSDNEWPELSALIFELEKVIATPVQTAVKRIDEQEFARLNATNLMFCEDAARRFKNHLEQMASVTDYYCKVEHQESLHAHNAVAIVSKHQR